MCCHRNWRGGQVLTGRQELMLCQEIPRCVGVGGTFRCRGGGAGGSVLEGHSFLSQTDLTFDLDYNIKP